MKQNIEYMIARLTTVLIMAGLIVVITAFAVDQLWGIAQFEVFFQGLAGLVVLGMILCVFASWWLAARYLLSRGPAPASPTEYLLLITAVFLPIAAIYVLRSIRRHEVGESIPNEPHGPTKAR